MQNAQLEEAQSGIKIAGRNINNLRYADDTILMAESEEELKSLWDGVFKSTQETSITSNIKLFVSDRFLKTQTFNFYKTQTKNTQ